MKMIFKGKDGSLGFRKGESYQVSLSIKKHEVIQLVALKDNRLMYCEYRSQATLFENWEEDKMQ
ncbi:hypothetical protein [Enterococcus mundtii]|uniref:hypothetical protein n=1 Tax=Enterococcus mundtii TaxID=53346 RepID=UPI001A96C231|nr:hypothetical protein [Enterococcus mundtii]MBO1087208.1 hypothetical protein [Enterococcus mundtii]